MTDKALEEKRMPTRKLKECFMRGSNTTCRHHIRGFHFEEYKRRVEAAKPKLEVHHAASPQWYLDQFSEKKPGEQQTELKFRPKGEVAVSTREGRLMACAQYIVVEDQVCWLTCGKLSADYAQALMTADKITFQNVLLSAKPDLQKNDLPSSHDVLKFIKNSFIDHMEKLKNEIEVSSTLCTDFDWSLSEHITSQSRAKSLWHQMAGQQKMPRSDTWAQQLIGFALTPKPQNGHCNPSPLVFARLLGLMLARILGDTWSEFAIA